MILQLIAYFPWKACNRVRSTKESRFKNPLALKVILADSPAKSLFHLTLGVYAVDWPLLCSVSEFGISFS